MDAGTGGVPKPELGKRHVKRLKGLFAFGRPVYVGNLGNLELDLMQHGYLRTRDDKLSASAVVEVTPEGQAHLAALRVMRQATMAEHNTLGSRLALHLRSKGMATWENVVFWNPYRTVQAGGEYPWASTRPDVLACEISLQAKKARSAIYEVKVTRGDFLADVRIQEKRKAYLWVAERLYYCCPAGMVSAAEVPEEAGLIEENENGGFAIAKRAKARRGFEMHPDTLMTMTIKRCRLPDDDD